MIEDNWYTRYCFEQECNEEIPLPIKGEKMKNFKLELTQEEVQIVGNALLELPAKISLNIVNKINGQLNEQINEQREVEPTPQATTKKQ